jgi:cell wall-associated NlpC family hydrolase
MSFAAHISRLTLTASLAAAITVSVAGTASPQPAFAAEAAPAQADTQTSQQTDSQSQQISQRARIVNIAESHVGSAQYRFGAEGTEYMDCSGLVWSVYKQAGLEAKIGGARMGAKSYYYWFKRRGLASRTNPKPGDLVIWHRGAHIGIYVGNGYAVSALNEKYDVRKHKVNWLSGFTAYLHVQLDGAVSDSNDGTATTSDVLFKVTSDVDGLIVRDGPGTGHDRIGMVNKGTVIRVIDKAYDGQGRKWLEGKLPSGKVGWVLAEYVTKV